MCGIAGYVGHGDEKILSEMVHTIIHRGPDYQGISIRKNVGLGHARLSIIDLSEKANQPFYSCDGRYAIVFNGEIYNYLSLKEELQKTNKYRFITSGDTEVLLYMYVEYGIEFLKKIHGMFAFGIYDFEKEELILVRDRLGKKPLYYFVQNNIIVFGSELKSILKHPSVHRYLDLDALNEYLTFDYVPSPRSIFKNIFKLEASHYLIFKNGAVSEKNMFWNVPFNNIAISFHDAAEEFDRLLNNAVKDRLMSDVPLGVFLSGGLDSSAVTYYAQKNSSQKIKTFSIGFSDKSYDESNYAKLVADKLGTEHYEQTLSAEASLALIPEITDKLDEPFADPSIIPTYFLSRFARQQVTVALGGDGCDELLAGYPTFISERISGIFNILPKSLIKIFSFAADKLPVSDDNISFDFKVKQFLKGFESKRQHTHSLWLGSFTPLLKKKLFTEQSLEQITNKDGLGSIDLYLKDINDAGYFNQILYIYYRTYLLEDILVKVDRASMFSSLEVRAPFLDTRIVEFVSRLPKKYKINGNNGKRILKNVMRGKIPDEIIDRPKKGFGVPLSTWLRKELKKLCEELLSENRIREEGIFNPDFINKLKKEHFDGKHNHRKLLWNLMIFELWRDKYYLNKL